MTRKQLSKKVSEKIRTARLAQGLFQADLAKKAGVSQSLISQIESGGVHLSFYMFYKIGQALGWKLL